ncbi:MAG: amino acid ABC transporter permease [Janthinobacterium lividum]
MSDATIDPRLQPARHAPKKPFQFNWSDPRFRNIVWQVLILGGVAALVWYLVDNTTRNLQARRIATGFAYLGRAAGFPIGEHLIDYDPSISTYGDAIIVGILNTLKVAVIGVVLATIWGTLLGVARLSKNWLISRLAAVYVEVVRDIPLLLQLLFWYSLLQGLPGPRQSFNPVPGVFLSNRGFKIPSIDWVPDHWWVVVAFLVGAAGTILWSKAADKKQDESGVRPKIWPVALGLMLVAPLLVWAALGAQFTPEIPVLRGFNFVGGATLSPEYGALTIGLVLYTSAYIAEIVRSGILAVPTGQWEAAGALGLRNGMVLRKIVLPQAMRVIIPPMTSQYLNLTKNSSLAVAIGYQDVTSIASTTLNQTGQAIEGIATIMLVYLTISLSISLFMNWYNARIALVER